jgi:hypothetical protein
VSRTHALTPSRPNAPCRFIWFSMSSSFMPADWFRAACHSSKNATVRLLVTTKKNPVLTRCRGSRLAGQVLPGAAHAREGVLSPSIGSIPTGARQLCP